MTIGLPQEFSRFEARVDAMESHFIERLRKALRIPSVSASPNHRKDVFAMSEFLRHEMTLIGIEVEVKSLGDEPGTGLPLPPIILGRYGRDTNKPTILAYSHYDVQPASLEDGWTEDPWEMVVTEDGRLCGRGTSDDKGPLLCWLNMIESFQQEELEIPVNLVFFFEGMEENGSTGLRAALEEEAMMYLADVDAVCITDTIWAGGSQPSITQGLRGVLFYILAITGAEQDAHSGIFGGHISEPMTDMVNIMSSLVDSRGRLLIPGIYDQVQAVTEDEYKAYQDLDISAAELNGNNGVRSLHEDKIDILISKWRNPALSLHKIENASRGAGATTSIPAKLLGKFSIRTVPNMEASEVDRLVRKHIEHRFAQLGSKNDMTLNCVHQSDWFFEDSEHWNYQAAINATKATWNVNPSVTCEGGSIPVALDFKQVLKKNVLLLPVGRPTDGAHSINEKLDKINYMNATKLYGSYVREVSELWTASFG